MSGSVYDTITNGQTLTLTSSLNGGSVDFSGTSGSLIIDSSAVSGSAAAPSTLLVDGKVFNFGPNDNVVLNDIGTDLSKIGYSSIASALPALFAGDANPDLVITPGGATGNSVNGITLYGSLTSNNQFFGLVAPTNGTLYNSIMASLELIELQSLGKNYSNSALSNATFSLDLSDTVVGGTTIYNGTLHTSQEVNINPHPCFAEGTRIATLRGEIAVEALKIGDAVVLADGRNCRISWIGQRDLDIERHARPEQVRPVRISAGAFAAGIPKRDLVVSPDHAFLMEGVLVQAKDLVDDVTIRFDRSIRQIRYFHVELPAHDILLAEGAAAESFLDTGHRGVFDNDDAPVILHPDMMQNRREAGGCAPLCTGGETLAVIRQTLSARKAALGYQVSETTPWLKAGGMILAPDISQSGQLTFHLPEHGAGAPISVELLSGCFSPASIEPTSDDHRSLGMAIAGIALDGEMLELETVIPASHRHPRAEGDSAIWTTGNTMLILPHEGAILTIHYAGLPRDWRRLPVKSSDAAKAQAA